ncbi:hypothetical protein G647_02867 [Cladophialophora carrionii CBS 160.54]|uniref:Uncharacterized protein n=1 Tax=Cladophialophora carrionii CBS 160.54 TaxID=1279043 RepID=V9DGV8_9EURO|nr:uncharacterized protein G647_02867 [Cladophialophora carrionii CBS 160.54]ETI26090.1 hypothetical protein G647_02867 [Cladophialophora carrionii CBS 160.54]
MAGYKGTVAIAPPTPQYQLLEENLADPVNAEASFIAAQQHSRIAAVAAGFPSFNYSGMTPLAYDRWMNVLVPFSGCNPTASQVFADVSPDQLVQPGWNTHPAVQRYANMSQNGRRLFEGPLLVLGGDADQIVFVSQLSSAVNDTCNMLEQGGWEESLESVTYQDMDHFPVVQASSAKWLPWVKDRLSDNVVLGPGCVQSVVKGTRTDVTWRRRPRTSWWNGRAHRTGGSCHSKESRVLYVHGEDPGGTTVLAFLGNA